MLATLRTLHALATDARDEAYRAYEVALRNSKAVGHSDREYEVFNNSTDAAYQALIKANAVRDAIYAQLLTMILAA